MPFPHRRGIYGGVANPVGTLFGSASLTFSMGRELQRPSRQSYSLYMGAMGNDLGGPKNILT